MNITQKVARFALCLGAFVAICSAWSGLGIGYWVNGALHKVKKVMKTE